MEEPTWFFSIIFTTFYMAETAPSADAGAAADTSAAAGAGNGSGTGASDSSSNGGAPGNQGGTQTFASDKERADHFEARHREATDTLRKEGETKKEYETRLNRYRETYGELEPEPQGGKPNANEGGGAPSVEAIVDQRLEAKELDRQIGRVPTLVPHAQEVKDLVKSGLNLNEAKEVVAKRHNITLGPVSGPDDLMPNMPGGGGITPADSFSNEQLAGMRKDGIDAEKAKKHLPKLAEIWNKAKKR